MRAITTVLTAIAALLWLAGGAMSAEVHIHYLRLATAPPPTLSNLDPRPEDLGLAGARLAIADNTTTGRFLGQTWRLTEVTVAQGGDFTAAVRKALSASPFLVIDAPAQALLAAADLPEAAGALLFNTGAPERALRDTACRANVLHTLPSRAMETDALIQFLVKRRWDKVALITGPRPEDMIRAEALRHSATKFGLSIFASKDWTFDADMRRNAPQEVPLFTQDLGDYDVLLVADEANDFARYIPFNTWLPRPVAGAEGLTAKAWDSVVEQWGAAQLQSRFKEQAGRAMASKDYAAWAAIRAIGEAVTRTKTETAPDLRAYMLSPAFELAGFKGRPQTFRPWNGQMRQPIPLVNRGALVATAPLDGFLHQTTELDTLGIDQPESACGAFAP